jgi:DNA damage-binding protein 1
MSPDFDIMHVDGGEPASPQELGNIVLTRGSYLNILERFKNIAPILDACLVDPDSGQVGTSKFIKGDNTDGSTSGKL